nr:acyl-CoA thioesterase domain-containing protein [Gordonia humi]
MPGGPPAVFGGQLLGQSVVAAGRTVHDGMTPTSMHAYFERPGDPATPIDYAVDEIRDSRSSARRLVRGTQYGRLVSTAELSFSRDSAGRADPVRPAVDPEAATWSIDDAPVQHREGLSTWLHGLCTMLRLDVRFLHEPVRLQVMRRGRAPAGERFLVRPADPIPEDPLVQAAAVAYLSDMFLLAGSLGPRGVLMGAGTHRVVSVDHSIWFADGVHAGGWLLHETAPVRSSPEHELCRGAICGLDGVPVADTMQEGLVRALDGNRQ